jgi:hypothetical protein
VSSLLRFLFLLPIVGAVVLMTSSAQTPTGPVTYEAFGAVGDGVADDLPAIQKAHAFANQHRLPVRSKAGATYHLGRKALIAIIQTDTDWGNSRFIIDDSQGVENSGRALFEVHSALKPVPLKIDRLRRDQTKLELQPATDLLVYVENNKIKRYIRKGKNQNDGSSQKEVFVVKKDGSIIGAIDWDYDQITKISAQPIDEQTLYLRGGVFINIANRSKAEEKGHYWDRNIIIRRSRTVVEGVKQQITGEGEQGHPYSGFLSIDRCAHVLLKDCVVDARKTYHAPGYQGAMVAMGTYGYNASLVVDFRMFGCRMGNDINDRSRWGIVGSNFMKNFLVEKCVLSRVDVHMGVSGSYIIRDSTLGHTGINAIGRGRLIVENTTIHSRSFISFRSDYGSTWEGDVLIRNSRWAPLSGVSSMFDMHNDGSHDFGYPCSMPKVIRIENLTVELPEGSKGINFFGDPLGKSKGERPFPYRPTETLEVKGLQHNSAQAPKISDNPEIVKAVKWIAP